MDREHLNEQLARARSGVVESYHDEVVLTVKCNRAAAEALEPLLDHIKKTGAIGHTFDIVVDPDNSDYRKRFGFDGDGPDRIHDIKVSGE
jgi:hypothetical protein